MNLLKRACSLLIRRIQKPLKVKKVIDKLHNWQNQQRKLPDHQPIQGKMLIIRLDEIGDYIVWRNSLHFYKSSIKWRDHHISLLGNQAWKSIFEYADKKAVDQIIWVDKNKYFSSEEVRIDLWKQLRNGNFETIICPSRTRAPLLDDLCAMAAGSNTFACENTFPEKEINIASDQLYKHIYYNERSYHEFFFNQDFANWCCESNFHLERPEIDSSLFRQIDKDYIICYIGASRKSRRLPVRIWVDFITLLKNNYQKKIVLAGGPAEKTFSELIVSATEIDNITGKVSLAEMINYTAFADAIITGDTIEAHLATSCGRPTVIIANGNNFARFSAYKEAGINNVETVYTKPFLNVWRKKNYTLFPNYVAVSDDIKTIDPEDIINALRKIYPL